VDAKQVRQGDPGKAVRLVRGHASDYESEYAAIGAISGRLGMTAETLRRWIRQFEVDTGEAGLKGWNAELERTIEILETARSFFARERDPLHR